MAVSPSAALWACSYDGRAAGDAERARRTSSKRQKTERGDGSGKHCQARQTVRTQSCALQRAQSETKLGTGEQRTNRKTTRKTFSLATAWRRSIPNNAGRAVEAAVGVTAVTIDPQVTPVRSQITCVNLVDVAAPSRPGPENAPFAVGLRRKRRLQRSSALGNERKNNGLALRLKAARKQNLELGTQKIVTYPQFIYGKYLNYDKPTTRSEDDRSPLPSGESKLSDPG